MKNKRQVREEQNECHVDRQSGPTMYDNEHFTCPPLIENEPENDELSTGAMTEGERIETEEEGGPICRGAELDLLATHRRMYAHERVLRPFLEMEDLTYNQALVLLALFYSPFCSVSDLARDVGGAQSNMSTLCTLMEKRGMLERVPYPLDDRKISLRLTAQGEVRVMKLKSYLNAKSWRKGLKDIQQDVLFK